MIDLKTVHYLEKSGHTVLSNGSLMSMKKHELVEYIRCIENNWCTALERCENQFNILTQMYADKEKCRWHDLRKNPDDLPEVNKVVLTYFANGEYSTNCMINTNVWAKGYYKYYEPIAWRKIEPFESEERNDENADND